MNCCNDAGHCTNGRNGTPCAARTREVNSTIDWESLKECYSLPPVRVNTQTDAPATGIHFAPGAIEHHVRPFIGNAAQRRELNRWMRLLVISGALCLFVGGVSGYIARAVFGA